MIEFTKVSIDTGLLFADLCLFMVQSWRLYVPKNLSIFLSHPICQHIVIHCSLIIFCISVLPARTSLFRVYLVFLKGLSILFIFSKYPFLIYWSFLFVSISFIPTLHFIISFLLLTLSFDFVSLVPLQVNFSCLLENVLASEDGPELLSLLELVLLYHVDFGMLYFYLYLSRVIFWFVLWFLHLPIDFSATSWTIFTDLWFLWFSPCNWDVSVWCTGDLDERMSSLWGILVSCEKTKEAHRDGVSCLSDVRAPL